VAEQGGVLSLARFAIVPARSGEAGGCRALINFQIFYQSAWSVTEIVAIKTLLFLQESEQIFFDHTGSIWIACCAG
jgi:hypothetical protein